MPRTRPAQARGGRADRKRPASAAKTPRLSKARAAFAKQLVDECGGRPLGPTLSALLAVAPYTDHFGLFPDETDAFEEATRTARENLAETHGIIGLGRASVNHFGVIASRLGKTIDASPIGYVDRHGGEPAVAAQDLAAFLRIVHFQPDILILDSVTAADTDKAHAEFRAGLSGERTAWDKLSTIPGVRALASGSELVALVKAAPEHAFASTPLAIEDLEAQVKELFRGRVGNSKLLIDVEAITVSHGEVKIDIGVNASRDRLKLVIGHRVVQEPIDQFLVDVRAAVPDKAVTVRYTPTPPENRRERDRSLRLSLDFAGARDLIETLGLT